MIRNLFRLYKLLGKWQMRYTVAAMLLTVGMLFRTMEPRILQLVVDDAVVPLTNSVQSAEEKKDFVHAIFYRMTPVLNTENVGIILLLLGLMYLIISILRGSFIMTASSLSASSTEKAVKALRDRLFNHIQLLPLKYHHEISAGELIQRSTGDMDTVRRFLSTEVVEMIRLTALFIFCFAMMAMVHLQYAILSVMFVPVVVGIGLMFFKREGKVWEEHEAESDKLNDIIRENLNGIRVVKAFANEDHEMKRFDAQNKRKLKIGLKHVLLHTYFWPISDGLIFAQVGIGMLAGGYFALQGEITLGELLSFFTYMLMLVWPMRQLGRVLSQTGMAAVAMGRIYQIFDAQEETDEGKIIQQNFKGEIEFRNISFRYNGKQDHDVLHNLSFKIKAGEKIAFVGPAGAGKSTIIKLLTRFYEPDEGEILIDGINIKQFSKDLLRQKIGVVLQKPFLFSTSIKENIGYAVDQLPDDELEHVASIASIHEVRHMFSDGYDTMVGEKGVTLSGGQKQRVALARTLASKPDILVMDDTTSAVDTETEFEIMERMQNLIREKTTIIISHRITSTEMADRIFVIMNGKISEQGTRLELIQRDGYYREIHELQSALESEIEIEKQ